MEATYRKRRAPFSRRWGRVLTESGRACEASRPSPQTRLRPENPKTLLVMNGALLEALWVDLRWIDSICSVSRTVQAARRKLAECSPPLVVTGITLPDGTWCDLARVIEETASDIRLLVAKNQRDEVLFGDVVRRGGYFALPAPHRWFSTEEVYSYAG